MNVSLNLQIQEIFMGFLLRPIQVGHWARGPVEPIHVPMQSLTVRHAPGSGNEKTELTTLHFLNRRRLSVLCIHTYIHTDIQTDRQTDRQTDIHFLLRFKIEVQFVSHNF